MRDSDNNNGRSSQTFPQLKNGYFYHEGRALALVGFNYWPSHSGVSCWRNFDLGEWEEDFREIRRRGYNTVRFFVLWPDFQPEENRIDENKVEQLKQVVALAGKYDLWMIPTVFQGWMSGTNFDPVWRRGRNHVCDQSLRGPMVKLLRAVCKGVQGMPNLLALDLANEIDAICPQVDAQSVREWTYAMAEVVHEVCPGLLVTNGTANAPLLSRSAWAFPDQQVDFHCVHGYPMFRTPLRITSLRTTRASMHFGAMTAFARAYGPVMREEYGTAIGGDGDRIAGFIRASSFASFLAGANGFLHWCWRDFDSKEYPYQKDPFESSMGYVDNRLNAKVWSRGLDDFQNFLVDYAGYVPVPDPVGIYIPRQFKKVGDAADDALTTAYECLCANGILPRYTIEIGDSFNLIVVPVSELEIGEIEELERFCRAGGCVIALGVTSKTSSRYWEAFTGFRQIDIMRTTGPIELVVDGEITVTAPLPSRGMPWPVLEAVRSGSEIWLENADMPWGMVSSVGKGQVVQWIPHFLGNHFDDLEHKQVSFWRKLLELVGYEGGRKMGSPFLQSGVLQGPDGTKKLLVINHSSESVRLNRCELSSDLDLNIGSKEVVCLPLEPRREKTKMGTVTTQKSTQPV